MAQTAEKVNAGSDRKVSEYTEHHSLLFTGLQTNQAAHADPCPPPKDPRLALELDHGVMEDGGLV